MQPYAQSHVNDADSPDNKHAQRRNNNAQQEGEQDDVKRGRLTQDKEFRGTGEEIKERLGDGEIPQHKEMQAGKKKVCCRAVRAKRLRCETHIPAVSRLALAPRVVEPARAGFERFLLLNLKHIGQAALEILQVIVGVVIGLMP